MRADKQLMAAILLMAILSLAGLGFALRESLGQAVDWQVLGNGGGQASSGEINLQGTLGQNLIGSSATSGGETNLWAGYWTSGTQNVYRLYLPLVVTSP
jgi:hypothetical protein